MPSLLLKSYAEKAGVSIDKVEGYWNWAKKQASEKFKKKGPAYWAYVNKLTEIRLGLKHVGESVGFKDFIGLIADK